MGRIGRAGRPPSAGILAGPPCRARCEPPLPAPAPAVFLVAVSWRRTHRTRQHWINLGFGLGVANVHRTIRKTADHDSGPGHRADLRTAASRLIQLHEAAFVESVHAHAAHQQDRDAASAEALEFLPRAPAAADIHVAKRDAAGPHEGLRPTAMGAGCRAVNDDRFAAIGTLHGSSSSVFGHQRPADEAIWPVLCPGAASSVLLVARWGVGLSAFGAPADGLYRRPGPNAGSPDAYRPGSC